MAIVIRIEGQPRAKGRPRVTCRGGRARAYTPAATAAYERAVSDAARAEMAGAPPLTGPVAAELAIVMRRPAAIPKREPGRRPHWKRPDIDNVAKAVLDGLVAGGAIEDDGQICELHATMEYAALGELPHVTATLSAPRERS